MPSILLFIADRQVSIYRPYVLDQGASYWRGECFNPKQGDSHLWVKFRCSGSPGRRVGKHQGICFDCLWRKRQRNLCFILLLFTLSCYCHHPLSLSPTRPMSSLWVSRARAGQITDDPGLVARLRPKLPLSYRHTAQSRHLILWPLVARKLQWGTVLSHTFRSWFLHQ